MVDDIDPKLRLELEDAKKALEPQIRGLHDLLQVSISGDLKQEISHQIEIRERRTIRIQAVLDQLDNVNAARTALEKDGYPNIEGSKLSDNLFSELVEQDRDLEAAVKIFDEEGAQNLSIKLGDSAPKPSTSKEKS